MFAQTFKAEDFEKKDPDNPLTWAYLPLTDYPKDKRVEIKAKSINGIAKTAKTERGKATLVSLVDQTLMLTQEEKNIYNELIEKDLQYKEANMLQSIEELGIEKGIEKGMIKDAQEMVAYAMQTKYNNDSHIVNDIIQDIKDREVLRNLLQQVILCDDFIQFKQKLDEVSKQ